MALELAITGVCNKLMLGLTPMQRLDALSKHNSSSESTTWFIAIGILFIAAIVLLCIVNAYRGRIAKKSSEKTAADFARSNAADVSNAALLYSGEDTTTTQIPLKKKIYIKPDTNPVSDYIEAELVENIPSGLILKFAAPVVIVFGQAWLCRYYTGSFVAEFKSMVTKCNGLTVVLNHSPVSMVNRRKFLRTAVNQPAFIAKFPFKTESAAALSAKSFSDDFINTTADFETPRFVPAQITELGGPGLRLTTSLDLKPGDRVLLMFKLCHDENAIKIKIIEHIGFVRHIIKDKHHLAYAIELTGLHDDGINELITATNLASIQMHKSLNADSESGNVQPQELVTV